MPLGRGAGHICHGRPTAWSRPGSERPAGRRGDLEQQAASQGAGAHPRAGDEAPTYGHASHQHHAHP